MASACFTITIGACADPCYDDGLAQGGCPTADTDSATETNANTMTVSDSMSGPTASETETIGTMSMGSNTETVTDTEESSQTQGECPGLTEVLIPEVATFQIVVDQSGSMAEDFGNQTRWEAMRATLVGMNGVVTDLQSEIRFGISLYNNPQGPGECPVVDTFSPQLDARDEIMTVLDASGPDGDTPTGESLDIALQTLLDDNWVGPKYILLATDGEPDTCDVPNPQTNMEVNMARNRVINAVENAFDEGVRTFVISVGQELADEHLQAVANAGQGVDMGDPDATFYRALDPAELVQAFHDIITGVRSCVLELPSALEERYAPSCEVTVNGNPYPYQDPNGWELADATHIELVGNACTAIQDGLVAIAMQCTCVAE